MALDDNDGLDSGSTGATGGTPADRGDDYTPPAGFVAPEATTPAAAPAAKAAEPAEPAPKAAEPEPEAPRDEKGRFIPVDRHKDILEKERERANTALRKLDELQTQLKQVTQSENTDKLEAEIVTLEGQYSKLILDGDHEQAAKLMSQIRLKERTIQNVQSEHLSAQARASAAEEIRMEMAITSLEEAYPMLKSDHENYDQDIVDMVLGTQRSLIENERMAPSAALAKAAQKVMSKIMPAVKEEPAPKPGLGAAEGAKERTQAQVAKNLETARKQPAALKDAGVDSTAAGQTSQEVDPTRMTYEEFAALPDAVRSRMRGDMV